MSINSKEIQRITITESDVCYEDNHIIVIHKWSGIPVQPDESNDISLFEITKDFIKKKYKKTGDAFLAVIHRIDRPVSGLVVFGKTSKAAARMSELFRQKTINKTYLAIVEGRPPKTEDTLTNYLWKDSENNKVYSYNKEKKGSKWAQLDYTHLGTTGNISLLEVRPATGRSHQIRVQLSTIGCPIVGDTKYGSKTPLNDRSLCLLAHKLNFIHPIKEQPIEIISHSPDGKFWERFEL